MATKADFSADEWKTVIGAMPMTGLAVACASPNGPLGIMKEMMSIGMAMADVLKAGSSNALINAVIEDVKARGTKPEAPAGVSSPEQAVAAAIAQIKTVGVLVDQKCGVDEGKEFKTWLVSIANRVAEASSEGGFFGIGGVRVSDAEKAAVASIAAALGLAA